jgi:hypothetical protein
VEGKCRALIEVLSPLLSGGTGEIHELGNDDIYMALFLEPHQNNVIFHKLRIRNPLERKSTMSIFKL